MRKEEIVDERRREGRRLLGGSEMGDAAGLGAASEADDSEAGGEDDPEEGFGEGDEGDGDRVCAQAAQHVSSVASNGPGLDLDCRVMATTWGFEGVWAAP